MYEVRVYKFTGKKQRVRKAKLVSPLGFFSWCRLWFTLKKYSGKD